MSKNFNLKLGTKLRNLRERLGLTLEEVSVEMGFNSYQIVSAIEDGSRQVKASELAKFSKIYHKDISYFLDLEEKEDAPELVLWRERSNDPKVKIKEQEFLKFCHNYFDLQERLDIDPRCALDSVKLAPDDFDFRKVSEIAIERYNQMQLGRRPACSLHKILEEKYNVKILFLDLQNYGSAASAVGNFGSAILINSSDPIWRRNYDLAHELFHIVTWDIFRHEEIHLNTDGKKAYVEQLADCFASELLLPRAEVEAEFDSRMKDNKIFILDIIGIAKEFVVSTDALLWRLVNLKKINRTAVEDLVKDAGFRRVDKLKRIEDRKDAPYISERYVNLAFKAFKLNKISKAKLAEYLNANVGDLRSMLLQYGYVEEELYDEELAAA